MTTNPYYAEDAEVAPTNQRQIPLGRKQEATRSGSPAARNHNQANHKCQRNGNGCQVSSEEESTSEDEGVQHVAQLMPKRTKQNPIKALPSCKPASETYNDSSDKKLKSSDVAQTSENKSTPDKSPSRPNEDKFHDCSSELPAAQMNKASPKLTNAEKLKSVETELALLEARIEAFSGGVKDKEYIYIDEMLTKALLTLDAIDSEGVIEIKNSRKQLVNRVQSLVDQLESKVRLEVEVESTVPIDGEVESNDKTAIEKDQINDDTKDVCDDKIEVSKITIPENDRLNANL
jgi:hypothetical protein